MALCKNSFFKILQQTIQFLEDIKLSEKSLMNLVGLSLSEEQKNFYDYLHLSPLKVSNMFRNCIVLQ